MWKQKVKNDYGISKMYDSTWKETARLLFESNMINLNANWVNGKTYKELFEDGLGDDEDYFLRLYRDFKLLTVMFPDYVHDIETAKEYAIRETLVSLVHINLVPDSTKKEVYDQFNLMYNDILNDEKMLEKQITTMTREFSVVAHAVAEIKGFHMNNDFGLAQIASDMSESNMVYHKDEDFLVIDSNPKQRRMNRRWAKLIDPMFYLFAYCLMSRENLNLIYIWN